MRSRLLQAAVALALAGALAAAPAPAGKASAGVRYEPILADLDGDHLVDKAVLVDPGDGWCAVDVSKGDGQGGYADPVRHRYPHPTSSPGGGDPVPWCPDMGVADDLGGNGTVELVVTSFYGFGEGLTVLSAFNKVAQYPGMGLPSVIGTADFNGDGLVDVDEWTDEGEGFQVIDNQPDGSLAPGPRYCEGTEVRSTAVADYDANGAADVAIAEAAGGRYGCDGPEGTDGVVVFYGPDGHRQDIAVDHVGTIAAADVSGDGVADLEVTRPAATPRHYIGGQALLRPAPTAVADTATTRQVTPVTIRVLRNDAATLNATVTIAAKPANVSLRVNPDRSITFLANGPPGIYHLTYALGDDGLTALATVTVIVQRRCGRPAYPC